MVSAMSPNSQEVIHKILDTANQNGMISANDYDFLLNSIIDDDSLQLLTRLLHSIRRGRIVIMSDS